MAGGLQVINNDGITQIDETYRNFQYTGEKWVFTTSGDHTFTTTSGRIAPIIVLYSTWAATVNTNKNTGQTGGICYRSSTPNGTAWTYTVNGIGEVYLFDLPVQMSATGTGIQVRDAANNGVFDSNNGSLRIRSNRWWRGREAWRYYYPVQTLSTAPESAASSIVETTYLGVYPPFAKPSGEKWGWIGNDILGGHYYENRDESGGPPNGDGNYHKYMGSMWASGDNFKLCARDFVYTGTYVSAGLPGGWNKKFVFVDLTNIEAQAGGGTVSTALDPGSQTQAAASTSYTFTGNSMAVSGGTVSSYSWSFLNSNGAGSWSQSSSNTATSAATVTGVANGATATVTHRCTVIVNGAAYTQDAQLQFTNNTVVGPVTVSQVNNGAGNETINAANTAVTFGAKTVYVTNASSVAYSWTVSGSGGSWVINSGVNSATATARVTGVANGGQATATMTCTVVADGVTYTRTCDLVFNNTTVPGSLTFSPVPGSYSTFDGTFSVTASEYVLWTWTKTGSTARNTTSPTTSGTGSTAFTTWQSDRPIDGAPTTCTISLKANNVYAWTITVTSTGEYVPPDPECVWADAWVETIDSFKPARDIEMGDLVRVLNADGSDTEFAPVLSNHLAKAEGFELTAQSGVKLSCSGTTPLTLRDGSYIFPEDLDGQELPLFDGELRWEPCTAKPIGEIEVAHISLGGRVYAAGNVMGRSILTHNVEIKR